MKNLIAYILITIIFFSSCQNAENEGVDKSKEIQLIEKTINNCIGWAKNKDIKLLYSIIANDSNYLEIAPGNRVTRGFENFKQNEEFWMNPEFKAIRYEIRDLDIQLSNSGDVAWWYCVLDDINEWKGQPANWENTRWTGVLEKRNGIWTVVQMHFSYAAK